MSIEIANESGVVVDTDAILAVARHALDEMGVNPLAELSVLLVDVDHMTRLHVEPMGEQGPTDVLSFPVDGTGAVTGPRELGDVVICPEHADDVTEAVVSSPARDTLQATPTCQGRTS